VDIGKTELVKWAVFAFKGLYSYYAYTSSGSNIGGPSLVRVGPEKAQIISGWKNPAHDHPTWRIEAQFLGRAQT
jgi:hypothetical protein